MMRRGRARSARVHFFSPFVASFEGAGAMVAGLRGEILAMEVAW